MHLYIVTTFFFALLNLLSSFYLSRASLSLSSSLLSHWLPSFDRTTASVELHCPHIVAQVVCEDLGRVWLDLSHLPPLITLPWGKWILYI